MTSFDSGPLADVSVHSGPDGWALVFVKDFAHPPEKVWRALTAKDEVGQWAPFIADRDLDTTGPAVLSMVDGDTVEPATVDIRRVEPPRLLEYDWVGDHLRWELVATDTGTRLTLTHTHANRDWMPRLATGWHLCLAVADHLLGGDPVPPIRGRDALNHGFEKLSESYADTLGIPLPPMPDA